MKQLCYIILIGFLLISCHQKSNKYEIVDRTKIIKKGNCNIPISYPEIKGLKQKNKLTNLNKVLEDFPEHDYYAHDYNGSCNVKGEYQVLVKNDSILSVEFRTIINRENDKVDTIFHAIVLNPLKTNDDKLRAVELEQVIPNFNRGLIYPFIEKYDKRNKVGINLLAYKTGSNHVIMWAIAEKHLIIYAGGEGEWFGLYKIKIPLDELKTKATPQ